MPLVKFDNTAGGLSGSMGDKDGRIIYYMVDGRGIARQFTFPRQPDSTDQQRARAIFHSLSQQFSQLHPRQAMVWKEFAANWLEQDRMANQRSISAQQAFIRVNTHRLLAGAAGLEQPPQYVRQPAPNSVERVDFNADNGALRVTLNHQLARGVGYWRLRLTPTLRSPVRQARLCDLRMATIKPEDSYVEIRSSPHTIRLTKNQLRFAPQAGKTCGVEALALSADYVPGEQLFVKWIEIQ